MLLRHARMPIRSLAVGSATALTLSVGLVTPVAAAPFTDTTGSSAEEAINALADEGVVEGCREGEFCPWDELTRAQLATVLVAALDLPTAELSAAGEASRFEDVGNGVHASNIEAIAEAGIVQGCEVDAYCPDQAVTRGQMATMLAEAFDLDATDEEYFDDGGSTHGAAVNQLAAAGIGAGCDEPLTAFCTHLPVARAQAASFLARGMDLVERVEVSSLAERRAQQAELDAAAKAEAEAAAKAEAEAAAKAAADAEAAASAATSSRDKIWADLAQCESGGNWSINTGNGYFGGLQFSLSSWKWVGGSGYPHQASRAEQIRRAEKLLSLQGWGAWPACSSRLGYR